MEMVNLNKKALVVDILSKAFNENKSVNSVVGQDHKREIRISKLIEYSFNVCYNFGEVWVSDDQKACALILHPDKKRILLKTLLWDIKLAISVIGLRRVLNVLKRETLIKSFHPKERFSYLWFIGVIPEHQSSGKGSDLLREIIEHCKRNSRPIYLETSVERNIPWYESLGFEIFKKLHLSYTLYLLKKDYDS